MSAYSDLETAIYKLLEAIPGEDVARPGLRDTPERVAKFLLSEAIHGYTQSVESVISHSLYEGGTNNLVVVKDIPFYSLCEHHFIPFFGVMNIGYVPKNKRNLDIAKFGRVVDVLSKRLQNQERLTEQISEALYYSNLNPNGVIVIAEAEHLCMAMRGARKSGATSITKSALGLLRDDKSYVKEFMNLIK